MAQSVPDAGESAAKADAREAAPGLAPGTVVADRYRIERLLGEGGMGAVYRAEHVHMRKAVALKVLHPDASEFPEVVQRFEREAIAAAHIAHPNVVSATDFGKLPDGSFFLVLEYVDGLSLRDAIGRGPLAPDRALYVVAEIASALVVAHRSGVVHRDLKPENIMLVAREGAPEAVKVFDFGIAKIDVGSVTGKQGSTTLQPITRVGTVFGTPDYMAPEQAMGQPVDGRADIYALGVMLFEMLTGVRPYKGGAVTLMRQHILHEVPDLPVDVAKKVDPRVAEIVKKCLAKDASDRYANAAELVDAVEAITGRSATPPPPVATSSRPAPPKGSTAPAGDPGTAAGSAAPRPQDSTPSMALTPAIGTPAGDKSWRPVARAAYSAEASSKRKRRLAVGSAVGLLAILGAIAVWSMDKPRPTSHAAPTTPDERPAPTTEPSSSASAQPSAETATAPSASAAPAAAAAAENPEPAASVERTPPPEVSAKPTPPPTPTPTPAVREREREPSRPAPQRGSGKGKPPPRKTGPGGIYIPPPKDWIK